MSRLQGWTAFDGLPGSEDGGAPTQEGMRNQPSSGQGMAHQPQSQHQQGQRYNPPGMFSQGNQGRMQGSSGNGNGVGSRSGAGMHQHGDDEDVGFLKPVAERVDLGNPSGSKMSHTAQQPSAPHSPQQQQRPIGPMAMGGQGYDQSPSGGYGSSQHPDTHSPQQLLMRSGNDGFMQYQGMSTSPLGHVGRVSPSSLQQHPGGGASSMGRMPAGFQAIQGGGIAPYGQHPQNSFNGHHQGHQGHVDGLRMMGRPSPNNGTSTSPSPTSHTSLSPLHANYSVTRANADDVADMLSSTHLDRDGGMPMHPGQGSPTQHQMHQVRRHSSPPPCDC